MHSARIALKMLITMIVLTSLLYPLLITLIAQLAINQRANGSLVRIREKVIGSELIAQNFKGEAYFWPRPSAVDFDPIKPAGGSNLGPTSQKLKERVEEKEKVLGLNPPSELVYSSGSGLDPHISLETADFQLDRIAKARSIADADRSQLRSLIRSQAQGFKAKYVNVLLLNIILDQKFPLK
jgi:potassium-transporting ATPase KdpC subunit